MSEGWIEGAREGGSEGWREGIKAEGKEGGREGGTESRKGGKELDRGDIKASLFSSTIIIYKCIDCLEYMTIKNKLLK